MKTTLDQLTKNTVPTSNPGQFLYQLKLNGQVIAQSYHFLAFDILCSQIVNGDITLDEIPSRFLSGLTESQPTCH